MMKRVVTVLAVFAAAACTNQPAPPPATASTPAPAPQTTLTLKFDGGYAFVSEKDGTMTVAAPKDAGATQMHMAPLLYDLNKPAGTEPYNLDNFAVSIVGLKAGPVNLPSGAPIAYPKPDNCSPEAAAPAGGSLPISALTELPGGPAEFTDADLDGRLMLSGGDLRILKTHGCWQLGTQPAAGMVTGRESVTFSSVIDGNTAELRLTHLTTGVVTTISIPATNGAVALKLGWKDMPGGARKIGEKMTDFGRYYRLTKAESRLIPKRVALTDSERTEAQTEKSGPRPFPDCGSIFAVRK